MKTKHGLIYTVIFIIFLTACENTMNTENNEDTIGVASLNDEQILAVRLRTEDGFIAESYFELTPSDSRYQKFIDHVGGIEPGEEKPIPPWPDDEL